MTIFCFVKFSEDKMGFKDQSLRGYQALWEVVEKKGSMLVLVCIVLSVSKDGGKEEKKKDKTTSSVKCYFVRTESRCFVDQRGRRCLF
ncbi:RNA-directed RNA polymerase [Trifolium repens]|nr:RNA-directed RNA polymerase [Trifolium repens]